MRKLLLAGAGAIALVEGSSNAADLAPLYAPPPAFIAMFNWTGCYVGGNGGGIWANSNWADTILGAFGDNTPSGVLGGAQAGCNYQASGANYHTGGLVLGIQGDYDWTDIKSSIANSIPLAVAVGLSDQTQIKSVASVTGRVVCTAALCGIATTGVSVRTDINLVKAGLNLKFGPF